MGRAIRKAYNVARKISPADNKYDNDYVERCELRMLLVYLKVFFDINECFSTIDADDDRILDFAEFEKGKDKFAEFGLDLSNSNLQAVFSNIDSSGNGQIYIAEFCDWAGELI